MIDPRFLDQLSSKLSGLLPNGATELKEDLERNVRANLQSAFSRMELVSSEEFAIQNALLERTRMKLEALEARVAELEAQLLPQTEPQVEAPQVAAEDQPVETPKQEP